MIGGDGGCSAFWGNLCWITREIVYSTRIFRYLLAYALRSHPCPSTFFSRPVFHTCCRDSEKVEHPCPRKLRPSQNSDQSNNIQSIQSIAGIPAHVGIFQTLSEHPKSFGNILLPVKNIPFLCDFLESLRSFLKSLL